MASQQFTIRSLLILTALVAADGALLRSQSDSGETIAIALALHATAAAVTFLIYAVIERFAVATLGWQSITAILSTLLAAGWFGMLSEVPRPSRFGPGRPLSPVEVVYGVSFIAWAFMAIAAIPTATGLVIALVFERLYPSKFRGRVAAIVTGLIAAAICIRLLFLAERPTVWIICFPPMLATVFGWLFGAIVDRAPIQRTKPAWLTRSWPDGLPATAKPNEAPSATPERE